MPDRQCPFLEWKNSGLFSASYRCRKTDQDILTGSSLYNSYCNNYESNYSQCPHFKPEPANSGCYLTSACVEAMGLADDCYELTVLREFRDAWLMHQPGGVDEVNHYYDAAPRIVLAIRREGNFTEIFRRLYSELVLPCVRAFEAHEFPQMRQLYRAKALELEERYL